MSDRKRGLGRGLGALIPTGPAPTGTPSARVEGPEPTPLSGDPVADWIVGSAGERPRVIDDRPIVEGAWFAELPVDSIRPNPKQPRQVFDEDALAELVHSIGEIGLLQPVVVRPVASGGYELVVGERRWRAHQAAGLAVIPAIVRETADDDLLRDALLENLHRSQLNPLEEAAAYQQLLDDFGCTHDELARRIGRSRPQISNTLRLLKLPTAVQRRVAAGVLSAGHARALLSLPDAEAMDRLATRIVAEGLSVRSVEEIVALGVPDASTSAPTPRARRPATDPELLTLVAGRLGDRVESRVQVSAGARGRGRIVIEFGDLDDLVRIADLIDPRA
jgi:ParB family chromosome partitioning protein